MGTKRSKTTDPEDLSRRLKQAARRGLLGAGHILEEKIVRQLSQPGRGRPYKNRKKGMGDHRASAPGEPPAVDTGRLRSSVTTVEESTESVIRVSVGTDVEYAESLEFGRRHMAPRPFMRPALGLARKRMTETLAKALRGGARAASKGPK